MKRTFEYLKSHQTVVLSVSLALMFSSSVFALIEGFSRLA